MLVHLDIGRHSPESELREFEELVLSAGGVPVAFIGGHRTAPDTRLFAGSGKVNEIADVVAAHGAQLVIFDHALSPSQERNLEKQLQCRVLDRTGLILDIFAQRARTHEGKLQVELAQLRHLSTRLVRGWTHLERQRGGIGLRGPGETQLEMDRRLIRDRISNIQQRLEKVRKQRAQGRRARQRNNIATVSLVGYTNAGKSTLFNKLADAQVYAADQLFATLDPTMRKIILPDTGGVILADTVGFIRNLPHQLVEAFRSTLEEVASADLLIHVIDAQDSLERDERIAQVNKVLQEIGAAEVPCLQVYNKIDLVPGQSPRIEYNQDGTPERVWISAETGAGIGLLLQALDMCLRDELFSGRIKLQASQQRLRAKLFAAGAVRGESVDDNGSQLLEIRLPLVELERILHAENLSLPMVMENSKCS